MLIQLVNDGVNFDFRYQHVFFADTFKRGWLASGLARLLLFILQCAQINIGVLRALKLNALFKNRRLFCCLWRMVLNVVQGQGGFICTHLVKVSAEGGCFRNIRTVTVLDAHRQGGVSRSAVWMLQTVLKDVLIASLFQTGFRLVGVAAVGVDRQRAMQTFHRRSISDFHKVAVGILDQELGVGRGQMIVSQNITARAVNVLDDIFIQMRDRLSLVTQLQLAARACTTTLIRCRNGVVSSLKPLQHFLNTQVAEQTARPGVRLGISTRTGHRHLQAIGNEKLVR
ncbi:Uncharacterised protein [Alcaligenes faecalis subsp. faecalis]|nr:Uncharacterised protein [Alcaligenes faecalis subsp. faecalis]